MKRQFRFGAAMIALVLLSTGCSWTQVQLWFQVRGVAVAEPQAREVADKVNAQKSPVGCDEQYFGACIPDNITSAYCAGLQPADGFAVTSAVTPGNWNHLNLAKDRLGITCGQNSPLGGVENVYESLDGSTLTIVGTAYDLDTDDYIDVHIYAGPRSVAVRADQPGANPMTRLGTYVNRRFTATIPVDPGPVEICAYGINVGSGGNSLLGCQEWFAGGAGSTFALMQVYRMQGGLEPLNLCTMLQALTMVDSERQQFDNPYNPAIADAVALEFYSPTPIVRSFGLFTGDAYDAFEQLMARPGFAAALRDPGVVDIGVARYGPTHDYHSWRYSAALGRGGTCDPE